MWAGAFTDTAANPLAQLRMECQALAQSNEENDARPTQTIDRDRDTVSLQWSRVAGARSYQIFIRSIASSYGVFATDTSIVMPGTLQLLENGDDVFERRLTHQLAVIAVDRNYFEYYHRTSDLFTARGLVMHVDGGIGVFGSVVTVATRTIVVK